jgi:hypothetical protein
MSKSKDVYSLLPIVVHLQRVWYCWPSLGVCAARNLKQLRPGPRKTKRGGSFFRSRAGWSERVARWSDWFTFLASHLLLYAAHLPRRVLVAATPPPHRLRRCPMCDPPEVSYTIMPNMGYFKLLSHDPADANVKPVSARDDTPPSPMEKGLVGEEERSPSCLGSSRARGVRHCATRSTACCCARRKRSRRCVHFAKSHRKVTVASFVVI